MESNWISLMQEDADKALKQIYQKHRPAFLQWIQNTYKYKEADAEDFFQETLIVFYEKVKKGKLEELTCELKTYLYAIAKFLILKDKSKKKLVPIDAEKMEYLANSILGETWERKELSPKAEKIILLMQKMKDPCKSILYLYYYKEYRLKRIAEEMDYSSADSVKVQKHRCMSQFLKALDRKQTIQNG